VTVLHIDFETRSELDLREVGLHRYARHASTAIWCMAYAFGDEEPRLWTPGQPIPQDVAQHVASGYVVKAHNAPFELEIWSEILASKGWPALTADQTICTMSLAYAMGLPGALEDGALALGLHMLKDTEGRAIMLKFARPWRTEPTRWMDECPSFTVNGNRLTGAEGLARLKAYCQQDVRVERELDKRLMPLSAYERKVWLLDYKINQRGVAIDMPSARAAVAQSVLSRRLRPSRNGLRHRAFPWTVLPSRMLSISSTTTRCRNMSQKPSFCDRRPARRAPPSST
jgi:DNA polymerase